MSRGRVSPSEGQMMGKKILRSGSLGFLVLSVFLSLPSCKEQRGGLSSQTDRSQQEQDRRVPADIQVDAIEVVFRQLLEDHMPSDVSVVCLSVMNSNPSDELLEKLGDDDFEVKEGTSCDISGEKPMRAIDRESGDPAIILRVGAMKYVPLQDNGRAIELEASYYVSPLGGASGYRYRLILEGGEWAIMDKQTRWLS